MKHSQTKAGTKGWLNTFYPLFLIIIYITGVAFANTIHTNGINWHQWMHIFMAGFFLVFSAFKFLDLPGFARTYATYDILAGRWPVYGYIYPFIELALGLAYAIAIAPTAIYLATIFIMGFSSLGVIKALRQKGKFRCACLGTILNLPMSSITLIEDLLMVAMAAGMLIARFC
ncbi:MAG TPA: MauE/DoxX family redox-associated membrane protein [Gammaproteobacteria bacterium]|nr:MauE/DoxX family redox-associated membrane protein [Gammaproteobacteria bacterium]